MWHNRYLGTVICLSAIVVVLGVIIRPTSASREMSLGGPNGGPFLMVRPQRPAQFRHEGEVKAYLQKLRNWVEDSMRNNARFGKRGYQGPSNAEEQEDKNQHVRPRQWKEYDYYNRR